MWRKNPIPRTVNEWFMYGASYEPVCEESPACANSHYSTPAPGVCKCSGDWVSDGRLYPLTTIENTIIICTAATSHSCLSSMIPFHTLKRSTVLTLLMTLINDAFETR